MFEDFEADALQALNLAEELARGFGHQHVSTGHLLFGLAEEKRGLAGQVLRHLGVESKDLKRRVHNLEGVDYKIVVVMDYAKLAREAFSRARSLAGEYGSRKVRSEHLLAVVCELGGGTARLVLDEQDFNPEKLVESLKQYMPKGDVQLSRAALDMLAEHIAAKV